jgi:hypothetical protein
MSKNNGGFNSEDFFPFKFRDLIDFNCLLKQTKNLVKNSESYNSYIKKYSDQIQITTFKLPQISNYPILKNPEIIPLSKTNGFILANNDSEKKKINFSSLSLPDQRTKIQHSKTNSVSRYDYSKKIIQSRNESTQIFNNKNNIEVILQKQNLETYNCSFELSQCLNEIDIFVKEQNSEVVYDSKSIYNNYGFHFNTIRSKLEYYKLNKNENSTTSLHKKINANTNKEILLKLESLKFKFTNLTDKSKPPQKVLFPLALIPVFYCGNFEFMKTIVLSLFIFNDEYDSVRIDESEISDFLLKNKVFNFNENEQEIRSDRQYFFKKNRDNIYQFYWVTPIYVYQVDVR